MFTIYLNQLRFHAFHGIYEEEKLIGNSFEVSLKVKYTPPENTTVDLDHTINYVTLFEWVKKRMDKPEPLLENLAKEMAEGIMNEFSMAEYVKVKIDKLSLPIAGIEGSAGVSYEAFKISAT